jgi:hypothetical protein
MKVEPKSKPNGNPEKAVTSKEPLNAPMGPMSDCGHGSFIHLVY